MEKKMLFIAELTPEMLCDAVNKHNAAQIKAIRESGAWVRFDGVKWYAMRVGNVVDMGEGATVEEAIGGLEGR